MRIRSWKERNIQLFYHSFADKDLKLCFEKKKKNPTTCIKSKIFRNTSSGDVDVDESRVIWIEPFIRSGFRTQLSNRDPSVFSAALGSLGRREPGDHGQIRKRPSWFPSRSASKRIDSLNRLSCTKWIKHPSGDVLNWSNWGKGPSCSTPFNKLYNNVVFYQKAFPVECWELNSPENP